MSKSKTYFVSRHKGAIEWAARQGIVAELCPHFDPSIVESGDTVIGTLPVHLVGEVCRKGGRYLHLVMDLPAAARGQELPADDMDSYGAKLEEFFVGTRDSLQGTVLVGAWDDFNGEYGPERNHKIKVDASIQGVALTMQPVQDQNSDLHLYRAVYVERLEDSWRINVSLSYDDVHHQIEIGDDEKVHFS